MGGSKDSNVIIAEHLSCVVWYYREGARCSATVSPVCISVGMLSSYFGGLSKDGLLDVRLKFLMFGVELPVYATRFNFNSGWVVATPVYSLWIVEKDDDLFAQ